MAVRCTGDIRLLEQLGEKQDFECLLTERGMRHEAYALRVRRVPHRGLGDLWSSNYAVTVTRTDLDIRHVYAGGPAHHWVERFAADAERGAFERQPHTAAVAATVPSRYGIYA
jgi:hypothetical protein